MLALRCVHPPGGAVALLGVIGGQAVHDLGWSFVTVVMHNAALLLVVAVVFNRLIAPDRYPAMPANKPVSAQDWALGKARFSDADLDVALAKLEGAVDVSRNDLQRIFALAMLEASRRRLGDVRARDFMRAVDVSFVYGDELEHAWKTMQERQVKAAPVVDSFQHVIGIITISDFVRSVARNYQGEGSLARTLSYLLQKSPGNDSNKPEVVGQLMTSPAVLATEADHLIDLVDVVTTKNVNHLPVVDEHRKRRGMVTRAEMMAALLVVRL